MFRKILYVLVLSVLFSLSVTKQTLSEEQYSIKEMTPQVQTALEQRRDRYDAIKTLKKEGKVGEDNRGYLKAFDQADSVVMVLEKENRDRKTIYKTIAEQNGIDNALMTIEKVFAKTQRDNASIGEKIQMEDGSWKVK